MARTRYGKTFRTRRGRFGRYKYVNGRRVGFVSSKTKRRYSKKYQPRKPLWFDGRRNRRY